MAGLKTTLAAVLLLAVTGTAAPPAAAASLVEVSDFGSNPGGMRMHVYVPDSHPARPAIVVAMHGCGGSGPGFHSGSEFASLADRYGFVVIYPSAQQQAGFGKCFDTWSDAAKHRGGGSDPVSIVSMVTYTEQHYGGDPSRVFATGSSSGGMMTNEMLALYPDVFQAGAAFMGVPFDCFAGAADYPPGVSKCTGGGMNRSPQQWGDAVRQAYPGYSGPRPRVQLWHGTADTLVPYSLLQEEIEQWTDVFGLSQTPTSSDTPQPGWQRRRYGDTVEAYSIQGAGHSLPATGMAAQAIAFFGLTGTVTPAGSCAVTATVSAWNTGLTENLTLTNTGSTAIDGWSLVFTLPGGQRVTSGWGATYSPASGQVTARNAPYNAVLAPNASITIGFQATHTGDAAAPSAFALNGKSCSLR
ncbi:extracellular catalytic domain type 1 short-chain-length polyhydroxyalkanoate depolymerase [Amycolatopsis solani]|uniref:extracellular catalytic domain type 1 short-chain-length polyhydroxyalkanoate depolymerase n=1 Tax=Amycolatopsis solani TaxID=3028615 RepID=UPI0025B0C1DA|nr:PHB depolymerase family esterase [Amycolatopsis sp. MEP2-6]